MLESKHPNTINSLSLYQSVYSSPSLLNISLLTVSLRQISNIRKIWMLILVSLFQVPVLDESSTLGCSKLLDNDFTPYFTCNLAREAFILGLISLCLTLINILFIIFSAMLFLKVSQLMLSIHILMIIILLILPQNRASRERRDFRFPPIVCEKNIAVNE